jgi:adenylate cyclase
MGFNVLNAKWAENRLIRGAVTGLLGAGLALLIWSLGWISTWEAKTWDWRACLLARPGAATDSIRLILLDQSSLDWALKENGLSWPWPREMYAAVASFCKRSGAKALAFDVLFTEPSAYGVADDMAFADAAAELGSVASAVFLGFENGRFLSWPRELTRPEFEVSGLTVGKGDRRPDLLAFPQASMPVPELANKSAVLGNVHLDPDPDGIYRRSRLFGLFDGQLLPALGLATFLAAEPKTNIDGTAGKWRIGTRTLALDRKGFALLRYRGPTGTYKAYSAAAVIQSEIRVRDGQAPTIDDPLAFKDKYVLFGFSAPGLYDLRSAPVGGVYPGVAIQATLLDNFLSDDFMRMACLGVTLCAVLGLALACSLFISFFSHPLGSICGGLFFILAPIAVALGAYHLGLWLPLMVQETGVGIGGSLALIANYAVEGRQKRFIKNAFKQYLSPAVIDQLLKHPERLKLGGERRVLSIFFSDLQGFTTISEGLAPEALTQLLNDYLTAMTDIIHEELGTVDKYEGDAIIAFWNAPLAVAEHATRAVRAALRCQAQLANLRPIFKERTGKALFMRIGLNTGPAVVGNMGSTSRFDYTMLGDAVNLAARLEGVNKEFGTYTMISESTRQMMGKAFAVRELGRVAVVGRKEAVTIYEPMLAEDYAARKEILESFAIGLGLFYRGDLNAAQEVFNLTANSDPPAAAYVAKCRELKQAQVKDFKGVWVMTRK